jgi:hypothetical protein
MVSMENQLKLPSHIFLGNWLWCLLFSVGRSLLVFLMKASEIAFDLSLDTRITTFPLYTILHSFQTVALPNFLQHWLSTAKSKPNKLQLGCLLWVYLLVGVDQAE